MGLQKERMLYLLNPAVTHVISVATCCLILLFSNRISIRGILHASTRFIGRFSDSLLLAYVGDDGRGSAVLANLRVYDS